MDNHFEHFSHNHPLTILYADYEGVNDDDGKDPQPYLCNICGLPILSSPSYTCSINGCNFFLHKPCAQLPRTLTNPRYHPVTYDSSHALDLIPNPKSIFSYQCKACEFNHHPLVYGAMEFKIKHESHQAHFLVPNCRETLSVCDVCGEEQRGFFFTCQECNFWIHQDCTLIPSDIMIASHSHPLILLYSNLHLSGFPKCVICTREMLGQIGFYYCGDCSIFAHISCAKSDIDNNFKSEISAKLIQLPQNEDEGSLVIHRFIERHIKLDLHDDKKMMKIDKEYHKHPNLILIHDAVRELACGSSNLLCDICIRPINFSSPFYTCQQQLQSDDDEHCNFFVHDMCATLLSRIDFSKKKQPEIFLYGGSACPDPGKYVFDSIFPCMFCHRPSNALCCLVELSPLLMACFECQNIPVTISHASHSQHIFVQAGYTENTIHLKCCSDKYLRFDVYKCVYCSDFYIHLACSLLPKRTQHKYDEHPLELITHRHNFNDDSRFCEFCEGDIDRQYWYYGCGECGNYFHINCIPSVGYLSKIKFGKTHFDQKIHRHPVTLIRMLTVERHERCGYCSQIIPGFADEMAFHCFQCDFWIHFNCARDSSCQPKLAVCSEVQENAERYILREMTASWWFDKF